jgi:catechol 2,3-dioxygenase
MARNPHYLSQLAHIEIYSSDLAESVKFLTDIIGLDVTARKGDSVYLRAWGDYFQHTLKVTYSATEKGMGHLGWRADSPEALKDVVKYLEKTGAGIGWVKGDAGHGKAYRFKSPDGHIHEVFWDVVWLNEKGTKTASIYADRYASNRRIGVNVRRFDHVTYMVSKGMYAAEKAFWQGMGLKNPDEVRMTDEMPPVGGLWTIGNLSHDIAVFTDPNIGVGEGVLNHIAFNLDSREEVLLGLDYILEKGHKSIMGSPTRHKADEGFFVYVMIPASGVIFEFYACARLIFAPDHGPDVHYLKDNPNDAWGSVNPFAEMAKGKKLGLSEDGTVKPHDI